MSASVPLGAVRMERNREAKRRAFARELGPGAPADRRNARKHDREPEAGAFLMRRLMGAEESLEQVPAFLFRNANPVVDDVDDELRRIVVVSFDLRIDLDDTRPRVLVGIFDRVANEV